MATANSQRFRGRVPALRHSNWVTTAIFTALSSTVSSGMGRQFPRKSLEIFNEAVANGIVSTDRGITLQGRDVTERSIPRLTPTLTVSAGRSSISPISLRGHGQGDRSNNLRLDSLLSHVVLDAAPATAPASLQAIYGDTYHLQREVIDDGHSLTAVIDACGKTGNGDIGATLCMRSSHYVDQAWEIARKHRVNAEMLFLDLHPDHHQQLDRHPYPHGYGITHFHFHFHSYAHRHEYLDRDLDSHGDENFHRVLHAHRYPHTYPQPHAHLDADPRPASPTPTATRTLTLTSSPTRTASPTGTATPTVSATPTGAVQLVKQVSTSVTQPGIHLALYPDLERLELQRDEHGGDGPTADQPDLLVFRDRAPGRYVHELQRGNLDHELADAVAPVPGSVHI